MSEQTPRNRAERRAAARKNRGKAVATAMTATKVGALVATSAAAAFLTGATPAGASTFTVTNTNTSGAGSLAQAIHDANADTSTADTITIASGLNIPVNPGNLETIVGPVSIVGPGAASSTITGQNASRVFYIDATSTFDVTISGLTLTHNGTPSTGNGGAIRNEGSHLTLTNDVITGNHALNRGGGVNSSGDNNALVLDGTTVSNNVADGASDGGGGVYSSGAHAELDLTNATVSGNTATHVWGGGLYFYGGGGNVQITNSTISDNTAHSGGGGAWLGGEHAHTTIAGSTISGNHALGSDGGGLALYTDGVAISNTTVSGNYAESKGGGLYFDENDLGITIDSSTITGNHSTDDAGGGISLYTPYAAATITNTTVSGNVAENGGGGGVYTSSDESSSAPISIYNSTISGNQAQNGWGGGLYTGHEGSPVSVFNSTISGNTASKEGGGVSFVGYYGLNLTQTTITNNTGTTFGGLYLPANNSQLTARHAAHHAATTQANADKPGHRAGSKGVKGQGIKLPVGGQTSSVGTIIAGNQGTDIGPGSTIDSNHSLFGTIASGTTVNDLGGTQKGVDPLLGPLADNGGPTQTHALLPGSPAINASTDPVASFTGNTYDQRGPGFLRADVVSGLVDIGAFEVQTEAPAPTPAPAVVITPKFTG
jgi:hypothetical protein